MYVRTLLFVVRGLFITLGDKYSQIPYKSCFQRVRPKVVMVIHIITAFLIGVLMELPNYFSANQVPCIDVG